MSADDAGLKEFHEAIGRAVVQWQSVEWNISGIFLWLLQGDPGAGSAAYHQIIGFKAQLGMVQAVADWSLKETPLLAELQQLLKRAGKKSRRGTKSFIKAHRS